MVERAVSAYRIANTVFAILSIQIANPVCGRERVAVLLPSQFKPGGLGLRVGPYLVPLVTSGSPVTSVVQMTKALIIISAPLRRPITPASFIALTLLTDIPTATWIASKVTSLPR